MAITNVETHIGLYPAAQDLSDKAYRGVRVNTQNEEPMWQLPFSSGLVQGILVNSPKIGELCKVQILGVAKVVVAEPVVGGRLVGFNADGELVPDTSTTTTVTSLSNGVPGQLIEVLLGAGSAGGGSSSGPVSTGTTIYDIPNNYMYIVFGEDNSWFVTRYRTFDETTEIQTGTKATTLVEVQNLTYT